MASKPSFLFKILFSCCLANFVVPAQAQTPKPVPLRRVVCNCEELRFTLNPGGSQDFILPAAQTPVRIEVGSTLLNGGTQEPTASSPDHHMQHPKIPESKPSSHYLLMAVGC